MASLVERNGRYCVAYSYKDKTGKRRQKWETYKTMQEAKKRKKKSNIVQMWGKWLCRIVRP